MGQYPTPDSHISISFLLPYPHFLSCFHTFILTLPHYHSLLLPHFFSKLLLSSPLSCFFSSWFCASLPLPFLPLSLISLSLSFHLFFRLLSPHRVPLSTFLPFTSLCSLFPVLSHFSFSFIVSSHLLSSALLVSFSPSSSPLSCITHYHSLLPFHLSTVTWPHLCAAEGSLCLARWSLATASFVTPVSSNGMRASICGWDYEAALCLEQKTTDSELIIVDRRGASNCGPSSIFR